MVALSALARRLGGKIRLVGDVAAGDAKGTHKGEAVGGGAGFVGGPKHEVLGGGVGEQ